MIELELNLTLWLISFRTKVRQSNLKRVLDRRHLQSQRTLFPLIVHFQSARCYCLPDNWLPHIKHMQHSTIKIARVCTETTTCTPAHATSVLQSLLWTHTQHTSRLQLTHKNNRVQVKIQAHSARMGYELSIAAHKSRVPPPPLTNALIICASVVRCVYHGQYIRICALLSAFARIIPTTPHTHTHHTQSTRTRITILCQLPPVYYIAHSNDSRSRIRRSRSFSAKPQGSSPARVFSLSLTVSVHSVSTSSNDI